MFIIKIVRTIVILSLLSICLTVSLNAQEIYKPIAVETLRSIEIQAVRNNQKNCSGAVAEVAKAFDINDLSKKNANEQIQWMKDKWETVDKETAQKMANEGKLVIAGLADTRQGHHGHVALIYPGEMATSGQDGQKWPLVACGSLNYPTGYCEGKSMSYAWNKTDRVNVIFYTAKWSTV